MPASSEQSINDVTAKAVCDIHMATRQSLQLKAEKERAIRDLLLGRYILGILPKGFGKSSTLSVLRWPKVASLVFYSV